MAIYEVALRIAFILRDPIKEPEYVYLIGWRTKNAYKILSGKNNSTLRVKMTGINEIITNSNKKPFEIEIALCNIQNVKK